MTSSVSTAAFDRLVTAMTDRVGAGELPGLVVLVARGDDVRVATIGNRFFDDIGGPMRRDTLFRIASVTKPIVATVAMMLVEDGTIALDEPVERLLPELADRRVLRRIDGPVDDTVPAERPITVEDLLTLRLGFGQLVEPTFDPPFPIIEESAKRQLALGAPTPRTPHDPDTWLRTFAELPLMYQPGQRWLYNVGSLVLGVLVARAAGQPLSEVIGRRIALPLGLVDTGFFGPPDRTATLPGHFMTNVGTGVMEEQSDTGPELWSQPPAFPSGAGGLLSTVDDLLAFARLLLRQGVAGGTRLLSAEGVTAMTTNHLTPEQLATGGPILDGSGWGYGMAVVVAGDDAGAYGWAGGYGTDWFNDPNRDLTGIVLSQTTDFLFNGGMAEFRHLAGLC
jgi:CubicO group peptidase (beta-lactamase class C family)